MDPNETLKMIDEFLSDRKTGDEVDFWVQDLFDWISTGGFEPDWKKYPLGASYYRCREVHHRNGERVSD